MLLVFLSVVAFIASIVLTVILYRKFVSPDSVHKITPGVSGWATFFRFDHLLVENILKALYMFFAFEIAFQCIALIIGVPFGPGMRMGVGQFFMWFFSLIIGVIVLEVILRIGFEFSLLTVLIWKNTTAIRKTMEQGAHLSAASGMPGSLNQATAPAGVASTAPAGTASTAPNAAAQTVVQGWLCPKCGHSNRTGQFCAKCGTKKA